MLPERPEGTANLDEDALARLVTRDAMIGVAMIGVDMIGVANVASPPPGQGA